MISRAWAWLRGLWYDHLDRRRVKQTAHYVEHHGQRVRSANICLANRGATKREKNNAWRWLCTHESNLRYLKEGP